MAETYEERGIVRREPGAVVADSKPRPAGGGDGQLLRVVGASMTSGRQRAHFPQRGNNPDRAQILG